MDILVEEKKFRLECICLCSSLLTGTARFGHPEVYQMHAAGQTSSVGSVLGVLRDAASRVQPSSEPRVDGIFPLELAWVLTSIP